MPQPDEEPGSRLPAIRELTYCLCARPSVWAASVHARQCGLPLLLQGNKKLDKAEILEMSIEYIQRMQQGGAGVGRGPGQLDLALGQKEWATDLTTWVIQNKILHSGEPRHGAGAEPSSSECSSPLAAGPNSLENFCQSLLLHLQNFGSGGSLSSATSLLLNQVLRLLLRSSVTPKKPCHYSALCILYLSAGDWGRGRSVATATGTAGESGITSTAADQSHDRSKCNGGRCRKDSQLV